MTKMIDIILSTYNGEKYLTEQIDSIVNQEYKNWNLLIRDDGSTDSTIQIINKYEKKFPGNITLINDQEGNLGPALSFYKLLDWSAAPYVAFCDQDDIWDQSKLVNGLNMLGNHPRDIPLLYFSNVQCINEYGEVKGTPKIPKRISFENAVVENVVYGCTIIINRTARDLLLAKKPTKLLMHDWWIYLVVTAFGEVIFDNCPNIKYRLHSDNTVGLQKNNLIKNLRKIFPFINSLANENALRVTDQLKEFLDCYQSQLTIEKINYVNDMLESKENIFKRIKLIKHGKCVRNSFWDSVALCAQVLIGKY